MAKDLHMCGTCRKIFNDINIFIEHKSQCSDQNDSVLSPNHDISLENDLFCSETVLDLTVLESGPFPFVLHYDNEEVISDINTNKLFLQGKDSHNELIRTPSRNDESLEHMLISNKINDEINEEDVANLLVTQLSKGVLNKNAKEQSKEPECSEKPTFNRTEEILTRNINPESESESNTEVIEETLSNHKSKNICKVCNFTTVHQRDLVRHLRKHTGERPYKCSVCDKAFARQDKLVTHKRIHSGDKRYKCHLCEYATTDSGNLRKHMPVHTNERPHKCQMCSYRARVASHMIVHLRKHTGDRPFFCHVETCRQTFKTSTDLKRHMKVHKNNLSPSYSTFDVKSQKKKRRVLALCTKKAYKCSHCSASFVRQDSLHSHLKLHQQNTKKDSSLDKEEPTTDSVISHSQDSSALPSVTVQLLPQNMGPSHYLLNNSFA